MAALTGKHFKLSKDTKRVLSTLSKDQRNYYKTSMIDAEHTYTTQRNKRYTAPKEE